jgi:ABC-type transporter Mla MlaB component
VARFAELQQLDAGAVALLLDRLLLRIRQLKLVVDLSTGDVELRALAKSEPIAVEDERPL